MKKPRGKSGTPETAGGSRGRKLSEEDDALWRGTASTLEPLKRGKPRVHPALEAPRSADTPKGSTPGTKLAAERASGSTPGRPAARRPDAPPAKPPPLSDYDKRKARKLGRGHEDVEARIDLHGMRQSEAHAALRRFLMSCHARGLRHVLVITGKGAPGRARRDDDWGTAEPLPGVLRRNVPMWLSEPDLRSIVVSFAPAAIRHGGEGALYVHLRNRDKVR